MCFESVSLVNLPFLVLVILAQYFCGFLNVHGHSCFTIYIHWFLEILQQTFCVNISIFLTFLTCDFFISIIFSIHSCDTVVSSTNSSIIKLQIFVWMWASDLKVSIECTFSVTSWFMWFDAAKLASYYLLLFLLQIFLSQVSIIFYISTGLRF